MDSGGERLGLEFVFGTASEFLQCCFRIRDGRHWTGCWRVVHSWQEGFGLRVELKNERCGRGLPKEVGDFLEQTEETKLKINMVMFLQQSEHLN
jgi:hypothetical protein